MTALDMPVWIWASIAAVVLLAVVYFIFVRLRKSQARRAIDNVISSVAHDELHNVLLTAGGQQTHINYLLLTQRGLLVIDFFTQPFYFFGPLIMSP